MSFNIRMNYQDDGPNNWEHRIDWIEDMVNHYNPGILGAQECYFPQFQDMESRLNEYEAFGPVEGRQGAESVALFYKKDRYMLLDSGTFWLSATPDRQSLGWDANLRRTVTWGSFRDRNSDKPLFAFVTHFDHKGNTARRESIRLLKAKVQEIAGTSPAVIMGDFNLRPDSEYYSQLTTAADGLPAFYDAKKAAAHYYGPQWTVNALGAVPAEKRAHIDYIFTNSKMKVHEYINIAEQRGDVFLSDHNPQYAVIQLSHESP
ncbi:endonuclease/exonuclease/phosphatase family protein [Parapedobacter deserti]|uniref:Endonuclease/exonuclease/phosphatase family protein n=1 Tax=Parapedobacter deserti TaxID=1912957 RepID=A0ABV7JF45_9SPHI